MSKKIRLEFQVQHYPDYMGDTVMSRTVRIPGKGGTGTTRICNRAAKLLGLPEKAGRYLTTATLTAFRKPRKILKKKKR